MNLHRKVPARQQSLLRGIYGELVRLDEQGQAHINRVVTNTAPTARPFNCGIAWCGVCRPRVVP